MQRPKTSPRRAFTLRREAREPITKFWALGFQIFPLDAVGRYWIWSDGKGIFGSANSADEAVDRVEDYMRRQAGLPRVRRK